MDSSVQPSSQHVVILGGGFAGVYAALEFEKRLAKMPNLRVTLVSDHNFFLFTPLLHEVAASDVDPIHIVNPLHKFFRRVGLFIGRVDAIDVAKRELRMTYGKGKQRILSYDQLILCPGSITNFHNTPGLEENALTMKSLGDAFFLRNSLIGKLEEANVEPDPKICERLLTVVVAGAGLAGVETMGAINDFIREAVGFYPRLDSSMIRMVIVNPADMILPELGEKLGRYALEKLRQRRVEVILNARVDQVSAEEVHLNNGQVVRCGTIVWTAGTTPHPVLDHLPLPKDHGRVVTNECLEVVGFPGMYALGDCAAIPDKLTGKTQPATAQHAMREGIVAARNILAKLQGRDPKPFIYRDQGRLASLGKRTAVANIMGINFEGFIAWWIWRTIYLLKLPGFEKKVRVAIDWALDLFFIADLVQVTTSRAPTIPHAAHDAPATPLKQTS
jgi:NADH:ubiquinone reductase (H+-translocating)